MRYDVVMIYAKLHSTYTGPLVELNRKMVAPHI